LPLPRKDVLKRNTSQVTRKIQRKFFLCVPVFFFVMTQK
jgi:hypothetical protein